MDDFIIKMISVRKKKPSFPEYFQTFCALNYDHNTAEK